MPEKQFIQAARNLTAMIDYNPHDLDTIAAFLEGFAEHVISRVSGSAFEGLTDEEAVRTIPDMKEVK